MGELDEAFEAMLAEQLANSGLTAEEFEVHLGPLICEATSSLAISVARDLRRSAPKLLGEQREEILNFERRNLHRWRRPLNLLETIWNVSAELSAKFAEAFREAAIAEEDHIFHALIELHARALLVASEAICLIKGGFADGALSRWRTLHELNVISAFISRNSLEVAHRYLASFDFEALKAAQQINKYAPRANLESFDDDEVKASEARCAILTAELGPNLKEDYGWASIALGVKSPNLFQLEEAVGLDHWRPRFKWASRHMHGAYRPVGTLLGESESGERVRVIGRSNSGMVDPLQMIALSLTNVTSNLLLSRPSLDHQAGVQTLILLRDEVGPVAIKVEAESLAKYEKKRKAK